MLDMAFQLLAFFIFTFKPSPVEGQISLRLPPPQAVKAKADPSVKAGSSDSDKPAGVETLVISVFATSGGRIQNLALGEGAVANVPQLERQLTTVLADADLKFEQVLIQVSPRLQYAELMTVIDACTKQKLPSGQKLTKLSFVELPEGEGG
ncbi:MAG: biopolymer transporter ExbD [Planctomycetales bacterium]|nr:biopolymer transporter ExbD [Planctomycetales bacterium]